MKIKNNIVAQKIFTGYKWLYNHEIIVENNKISSILPTLKKPNYHTIIPAFIDLQVYGANDKLFSQYCNVQYFVINLSS
jgi:N-acetylglucosamine-6-phosphate deacetylase